MNKQVEKIRAEIERRIALYKDADHISAHTCGYLDAYETLLSFIDSMQNDSCTTNDKLGGINNALAQDKAILKTFKPKFKVGDTVRRKADGLEAKIIEITNGVSTVECEDWTDTILDDYWEPSKEHESELLTKDQINEIENNISKAVEEEISRQFEYIKTWKDISDNDIEEAAKLYTASLVINGKASEATVAQLKDVAMNCFAYAAEWQKQRMTKDAVNGTIDYPLIGYDYPNILPDYRELKEYIDKHGIKDDDEVKLIIIKK